MRRHTCVQTQVVCFLLVVFLLLLPVLSAPADLSLSRSSVNFGEQAVNSTSALRAITLTNHKNAPISILSIITSGDFAQTHNCGASLPSKGKCTISVTFTPTALGLRTGTLTITHSGSNSPLLAALNGNGVPHVVLSTASLSFPSRVVGTTSGAKDVTLTNNQDVALNIIAIATSGDFAQTNTCDGSVPARKRCTISVTFTPTAVGARNGMLTVTSPTMLRAVPRPSR